MIGGAAAAGQAGQLPGPCRGHPHVCAPWCQGGGSSVTATVTAAMGAGTEPAEARGDAWEG